MKSVCHFALFLLPALLLTACPDTGIICSAGTVRCGQGCIDPTADERNCGLCDNACRSGQVCVSSSCVCSAGTFPCGGECTVRDSDPKNCGSCGNACASTEVCEAGACKPNCTLGTSLRCGSSCVDVTKDPAHCGDCATACENSQSCHAGHCTYDLVAACFTSGQVTGLQASTEFKGPVEPLGNGPQSLATYGEALLSVDGIDRKLYQARLASVGGHAFALYPRVNRTGSAPNQVVVSQPYVYVVNSETGSLQVLQNGGVALPSDGGAVALPDAGVLSDGGVALATVAEYVFGANTYPEAVVKLGNSVWVPLFGGFGASGAGAGQKVAKLDVSDPANPKDAGLIDLSSIDLKAFDGGTPVARPYAAIAHRGAIYVALNNLNPDTYVPEGPGLLAKIDAATNAVTVIDLGGDKCLNPVSLASDGTHLLVACAGAAIYSGPPSYALVSTDRQALVLLDTNDVRQSTWTPACPAGADGGSGCTPILLSRFAIASGRAYVGDQNGGRVFVLDLNGNTLGERRGYYGDAGAAIQACALDSVTGIANVSDVLAVP